MRSVAVALFLLLLVPRPAAARSKAFLNQVERRTFDFFWNCTPADNGLAPDRYPRPPFCSVAAVGFALTAYPIGVQRGYISRAQARTRVLRTLRFLLDAPQGRGVDSTGYKGFYYHFLSQKTGRRFGHCELSTIDTALLMGGVLFCQSYFDRADPTEAAIRATADALYRRVDWSWAADGKLMRMGWRPENGFIPHDYRGYNEAMLLYILALGSPTHSLGPGSWRAYTSTYRWTGDHIAFGPLFGYQYSQMWVDFRGIKDAFMRAHGIDYFENSRRATLAQAKGRKVWGLTACDGPGNFVWDGRRYWSYAARSPEHDDGTIAPTAAGGSLPFAPGVCLAALETMRARYGSAVFGRYGFVDAFNPSLAGARITPPHGRIVPGKGWFDDQYLGIDQGPILGMIENYRTGLVWKVMRSNPYIRRGLRRAGFRGGWLEEVQ